MTHSILCIAGSDSISGAGLQIDVKTAAAHGVYACCAVTAVTAQNTKRIDALQTVSPSVVKAQIEAVFDDVPPEAVKVGMLGSAPVARAVAEELEAHPDVPVVFDPVLAATTGGQLTTGEALEVIRERFISHATLVTPNMPEAEKLTGVRVDDDYGRDEAARAFFELGAKAVLLKGGHGREAEVVDVLYTTEGSERFTTARLPGEYHGTGCSLSTAIACNLASGASLLAAVRAGNEYLADALRHPVDVGHGSRVFDPLNHLDSLYGAL